MIIKKLIRQMLLAQILSAMTITICMLINSVMIGRFLGINNMSAYGYGAPLLLVFTALSNMICAGSQVLCGRTLGIGDKTGTDSCFSTAIMLALLFSFTGTAIVFIFPDQICILLGAGPKSPDNPVFELTKDYLQGFSIGASAFMVQQTLVPYMQMAGGRKRLVVALGLTTVCNIIFNLLNVFVFKMGIFGMGLAYALSYCIAIIIFVDYLFRKNKLFYFKISLVKIQICFQLIKEGTPILANQICLALLPLLCNRLLTVYGGTISVAAYSVISSVGNLCYSLSVGINGVSLSLSSMFFADKDKKSLKESMRTIFLYSLIIYIVVDLITLTITKPIVILFINDISAMDIAITGLRLLTLSFIPCVFNSAIKNYYQGIGHNKLTMIICILQNFVTKGLCAVILSQFWGITGIWLCFAAGEIVTSLLLCIYVSIKSIKPGFSLDSFLLLNFDFGINENNCYDRSITKAEEVVKTSESALDFCFDRGIDKKTGMYIALAIEEIGNNIFAYGFTDNRTHNIDIRLVIKEEITFLRIRDNCQSFDPVKYVELHQNDDPVSHIGIRMVMKIVKEARYENSFGLNNLSLLL